MSRYIGPVYKKARRYNFSILETGKELRKKPTAPGIHGTSRKKLSEYGVQLQEKQKVRFLYGLSEKQFKKTFEAAGKMQGIQGVNLLILLESRLDNLVYRMGFAKTRRAARQIVNHGHILVNGKKVDIPSFRVKVGSEISIGESSLDHPVINECLNMDIMLPAYVTVDKAKKVGTYVRYPEREELNTEINESFIVEFYSR
ncbi:MAG: 30S ribosomal protein S4 [Tenericutes bacterium]|nr:30S ribosomal protein S4 [Mycoplasmatota bacterium]